MRKYAGSGGNILFDGTDILSVSAKMDFPRMSKTKLGGFAEAVNLMMAFSTRRMLPVYYRILPGNVKDVTAFMTSLDEFGDTSATAIGDKGFYSKYCVFRHWYDILKCGNYNIGHPLRNALYFNYFIFFLTSENKFRQL